jgi:hypothetical protein
VLTLILHCLPDGIDSLAGLELPADVMRALQEEAGVMARMRHPNLVSFMGLCTLPPCILTGGGPASRGLCVWCVLGGALACPACQTRLHC